MRRVKLKDNGPHSASMSYVPCKLNSYRCVYHTKAKKSSHSSQVAYCPGMFLSQVRVIINLNLQRVHGHGHLHRFPRLLQTIEGSKRDSAVYSVSAVSVIPQIKKK